mgnify:CR=1 FL=1
MVYGELRHQIEYRDMEYRFREPALILPHWLFRVVPGLDMVFPPPDPGLFLYWLAMVLSAMAIALGLATRTAAAVFGVLYSISFLAEQSAYNNHYYLICMIAGFLACVHSDMGLALSPSSSSTKAVPRWHRDIFRFLVVIVYFYGGLAKINKDWLRGEPIRASLVVTPEQFDLWWIREAFVVVLCGGGLVFDLCVGFALLHPIGRNLALPLVLYFHASNWLMFNIGVFPFLMVGASVLFYDGAELEAALRSIQPWLPLRAHGGIRATVGLLARMRPSSSHLSPRRVLRGRRRTTLLLLAFVAFQLLFPLRHFVLNAPAGHLVHWNENGHKFSWHMKLRAKACEGEWSYVNNRGHKREIHLANYLTPRQQSRALDNPDVMWIFAQWISVRHNGAPVFADIRCGLNGRPKVAFTLPDVDIASSVVPWFGTAPFITTDYGPLEYPAHVQAFDLAALAMACVGTAVLLWLFRILVRPRAW